MSRIKQNLRKSLFNRYFALCSAVTLATLTIMGGLIIGFSASYFSESSRDALRKNAEQAAIGGLDYVIHNGGKALLLGVDIYKLTAMHYM